jgi:hypothetical protein
MGGLSVPSASTLGETAGIYSGNVKDAKGNYLTLNDNGQIARVSPYVLAAQGIFSGLGTALGPLAGVGLYNGLSGSFGKAALTNEELIIRAGQKAADKYAGQTGMQAGRLKHSYAESLVDRYQNVYGYRGILIEKTFNTVEGATRPDFFIQPSGSVRDLKFGQGTLSPQQKARFPLIPEVKEIKTINIPNK